MQRAFPELQHSEKDGKIFFAGPFFLVNEGREIERFEIEVELPTNFPNKIPIVRELEGKIKPGADNHTAKDGATCLFVPGERWKYWPKGLTLVDFLNGAVHAFFVGVVHKRLLGYWPFEQRGHGKEGIFEAYGEMLGFDDQDIIAEFIRVLAHPEPKGHWLCPCGSGQRIRKCHGSLINEWREKIDVAEGQEALKILNHHSK